MDKYTAAKVGNLARLKEVVTAVNVNEGKQTLLHLASWGGHEEVVAWLLEVGADCNARNLFGETPLHFASMQHPSHWRCVELLLEAGADAGVASNPGVLPLHCAGSSVECTTKLIAAYPQGIHQNGNNPLHTAVARGAAGVCRVFLESGCAVDAVDRFGHTALYYAFLGDQRYCADTLLRYGADLKCVEAIPNWVFSRDSCVAACFAVLQLAKRRSPIVGVNGRDVLRIVAWMVWKRRTDDVWANAGQSSSSSSQCILF